MMTDPDPFDPYSCDQVLRRLDDYVDRALTEQDVRRVEDHLAECLACAAAVRFERGLIDGIRHRLQRIAVPDGLRLAIHTRLLETLQQHGGPRLPSGGP
jgi:anti-sigma factor (TIGR02949 family)